jgi:hypothetical protein
VALNSDITRTRQFPSCAGFRNEAVGFIDWLDRLALASQYDRRFVNYPSATNPLRTVSLRIVASHENDDRRAVVGIALVREYRLGCLRTDLPRDLADIFTLKTPSSRFRYATCG